MNRKRRKRRSGSGHDWQVRFPEHFAAFPYWRCMKCPIRMDLGGYLPDGPCPPPEIGPMVFRLNPLTVEPESHL